jgi:hypothetical protein
MPLEAELRPPFTFGNSSSKYGLWLVAGDLIDSSKPQKLIEPLEMVSPRVIEVARGFRMSADIPLDTQEVLPFL